jgi:hypothetical protein
MPCSAKGIDASLSGHGVAGKTVFGLIDPLGSPPLTRHHGSEFRTGTGGWHKIEKYKHWKG